ncbi:MAG: CapA family protein [Clostridia bacterium]|nr:CapA family protein [Clostridia bacterium]
MKDKLCVTSTGDSLFTADFPKQYKAGQKEIRNFFNTCDLKMTNLETNLSDFEYFPNEYSGGTWINVRRKYFKYLKGYGFDFYGTANNHCMDYAFDGLMSTVRTLDKNKVKHAGTGCSLEEAEKPAIFTKNGKKIAVFAVDCLYTNRSKAGMETRWLKSRPGVNYLRTNYTYNVSETQLKQLKSIAKDTHINFSREQSIATGYALPDKEGTLNFGGINFTTDKNVPVSSCNKTDLKRICDNVKRAKKENDYVFILVHCHDDDRKAHSTPAEYMVEFSHALIDSGVSAVFGGGCHELRGIEIYKGLPIFYSLGDFIYQGMRVEILPADFMTMYGVNKNATAEEGLKARSQGGKIGLQTQEKNFITILPRVEFTGKKMTNLSLIPVKLGFKCNKMMEGLPYIAKGEEAKKIFNIIDKLSKPYGTNLKFVEDKIIYKK